MKATVDDTEFKTARDAISLPDVQDSGPGN